MATIIKFPETYYAPLRVRSGERHRISVVVTDPHRPEKTRWEMQWAMQRAASFRCLNGFNDYLAGTASVIASALARLGC